MAKQQRGVRSWLIRQCDRIESHVISRRLAKRDEVLASRPPKNATTIAWCKHYGQLRAWLWTEGDYPGSREQAEEVVLAALREEPQSVRLLNGETVLVYPKGLDALLWFREQSWLLAWLTSRVEAIREALNDDSVDRDELPQPVTSLEAAADEMGLRLAAICAVACSEGPQLDRRLALEPPQRWHDITPADLYSIHKAFVNVNSVAIAFLDRLVKPQRSGGEPMSWSVFMSTLGMRLKTDPAELARNRSLVSLLAQVRLSQPTYDEELEEAGATG